MNRTSTPSSQDIENLLVLLCGALLTLGIAAVLYREYDQAIILLLLILLIAVETVRIGLRRFVQLDETGDPQ